jgi:hypothetical protein
MGVEVDGPSASVDRMVEAESKMMTTTMRAFRCQRVDMMGTVSMAGGTMVHCDVHLVHYYGFDVAHHVRSSGIARSRIHRRADRYSRPSRFRFHFVSLHAPRI